MARILVALDGSHGSEHALVAAVKLAQQSDGQLTALTIVEQTGNPAQGRLADGVRTQAKIRLEEVLQAAANYARSRGVRLTPILREGHPAEAIIRCVEEENASLLVLGASRSPHTRTALGGTADQVSNHCPCTVMIVRSAA